MVKLSWYIGATIVMLAIVVIVCLVSYSFGRSSERAVWTSELEKARREWQLEREKLERSLGESQERAGRIASGLGQAIDIVARATDRNQRIAILIDAIDTVIRDIGQ